MDNVVIPYADNPLANTLPAGFVMGNANDPATYGTCKINGARIEGTSAPQADGNVYWRVEPNETLGPIWSQDVEDAITAAANAAWQGWAPQTGANYYSQLQAASPAMYAILTDPEWWSVGAANQSLILSDFSPEMQAKIQAVPALAGQLEINDPAYANVPPPQPPPPPPSKDVPPARYLINGQVVDGNGTPVASTDPFYYNAMADVIRQNTANGLPAGYITQAMIDWARSNPALIGTLPADIQKVYGPALTAAIHNPAAAPGLTSNTTAGNPSAGSASASDVTASTAGAKAAPTGAANDATPPAVPAAPINGTAPAAAPSSGTVQATTSDPATGIASSSTPSVGLIAFLGGLLLLGGGLIAHHHSKAQ